MKISVKTQENCIIYGLIIAIIIALLICHCCDKFKVGENMHLFIMSTYIILLILFYKVFLQTFEIIEKKDLLLLNVHEYIPVDRWIFSHFMAFMIAAAMYPKYGLKLFVIGIIWEIIEVILGYIYNNNSEFTWWYGSYKDPIANGLGILIGIYVLRPIYEKITKHY